MQEIVLNIAVEQIKSSPSRLNSCNVSAYEVFPIHLNPHNTLTVLAFADFLYRKIAQVVGSQC